MTCLTRFAMMLCIAGMVAACGGNNNDRIAIGDIELRKYNPEKSAFDKSFALSNRDSNGFKGGVEIGVFDEGDVDYGVRLHRDFGVTGLLFVRFYF